MLDVKGNELLVTDSVLENCYYTEKEYNRLHGVKKNCVVQNPDSIYEDEIYSNKTYKKKGGNTFLKDVPVDLVVDAVVHTLILVTLFWQ